MSAPSGPFADARTRGIAGIKAPVARALGGAVALLMAAAVVNVVWQVVSRFLLGAPSSFTDELARYLLVWIGLLGSAYAASSRSHIAVDLIPRWIDRRFAPILTGIANAAVISFALGVMAFGGARLVWLSFELGQRTAALGLPLGVVYLVIPITGLLMAFFAGCDWAEGRGPSLPGDPEPSGEPRA